MTMNKFNNVIKSCVDKDKTTEKESLEHSEDEKEYEKSSIEHKEESYESINNKYDYDYYNSDKKHDYYKETHNNNEDEYSYCPINLSEWMKWNEKRMRQRRNFKFYSNQ